MVSLRIMLQVMLNWHIRPVATEPRLWIVRLDRSCASMAVIHIRPVHDSVLITCEQKTSTNSSKVQISRLSCSRMLMVSCYIKILCSLVASAASTCPDLLPWHD